MLRDVYVLDTDELEDSHSRYLAIANDDLNR
jgi:hypothetical protein